MDNSISWTDPTDNITYPNKELTYQEYKELVHKVKESSIAMMCSSLSTAASHVNKVYRDMFQRDTGVHYATMAGRTARFNHTGD